MKRILGFSRLVSVVVLAAGLAACSGSGSGSGSSIGAFGAAGQARLSVVLHDDMAPTLKQATVTFSSFEVHSVSGTWVPVTGTFPMTVDLLTLVNGRTITLAAGSIPAGTYDRFRVTIVSAEVVLQDGTQITVTLPSSGGVTVERPASFTAVDGQPVTITLDFNVGASFKLMGAGCMLEPEINVDSIEDHAGSRL